MKKKKPKYRKPIRKKPIKRNTDLPEPLYNVLIKRAISNKEIDTRMAVVEAISSLEISFAAALKKTLFLAIQMPVQEEKR